MQQGCCDSDSKRIILKTKIKTSQWKITTLCWFDIFWKTKPLKIGKAKSVKMRAKSLGKPLTFAFPK